MKCIVRLCPPRTIFRFELIITAPNVSDYLDLQPYELRVITKHVLSILSFILVMNLYRYKTNITIHERQGHYDVTHNNIFRDTVYNLTCNDKENVFMQSSTLWYSSVYF
jgi:hypothetical protein